MGNSRLAKVALSSKVREYATGAAQSATQLLSIADFIAPTVNVASARFDYMTYDLQNRFRIPDAYRGIGGQATQVKTGGTEVRDQLDPYALDYPVDEFEQAADEDAVASLINERADITAQLAALGWSKKVIDAALTAAGSGTDKSAATGGMDFVAEIDALILAAKKASQCGEMCPVRVVFGPDAIMRFKNHSSTINRFKGGGAKNGVVNPTAEEAMSLLLGNPECRVAWNTYDSADEAGTPTPAFMLSTAVLVFVGSANPTRVDPSFMKTFRLRDKWMVPGTYERTDGRGSVFKFDWYAKPVVTNTTTGVIGRINLTA